MLHGGQDLRFAQQHTGTPQLAPQHILDLVRRKRPVSLQDDIPRRHIQHARRLHRPAEGAAPLPLQGEQVQQHLDAQSVPHIRQVECLFAGLIVHHPQIELAVLDPAVHPVHLAADGQALIPLGDGHGRQLPVLSAEAQLKGHGLEIRHRHLIGDILHDLADEFRNTMRCDNESAQRIISALTSLGAIVEECICLVSNGGRMSVELTLSNKSEKLSKGEVMREISRCCGRRFDLPTISREGNRIRIAMCEMPVFDVEIGSDQHTADNGKLCGDCINYFNDGFGKTYALVCDGMGTGGRAAVDGNMAASVMTRLLRAGLSADSCLQIVNSALMVKSEDESLSTVDVTSVDLYTGKTTFKKAGAPVTFVKKNGRVTAREMPSLPAGILNGIKFSTDTVNLTTGDMIVMVSGGVITGDDKWLEKLIRTWNEGSTQALAKADDDDAVKRRKAEREDDVTAVAIRNTDNGR